MDSRVVDYIKENKNKFPLDILKKKLIENGHEEEDINEAISYLKHHENSKEQENLPPFPSPDKEYEQPKKEEKYVENPFEHAKEQPKEKTSKKAITALILGIISLIGGWFPVVGWAIIMVTLFFGFSALKEIKNSSHLIGKGMAVAGIILAFIGIITAIYFVIMFGVALGEALTGINLLN